MLHQQTDHSVDPMTPEILAMLDLIETRGTDLRPPVTEAMVAWAEARLGVSFPPSYRAALLRHNGFSLDHHQFYGVPPSEVADGLDVVSATEEGRALAAERVEDGYAGQAGVADADLLKGSVQIDDGGGSGNCFWLLCGLTDAAGECVVGQHDHETDNIYSIVASSFPKLVWFLFDQEERLTTDHGMPSEELRWPYNEAWVIEQDPAIVPWLAWWSERDAKFDAATATLRASLEPGASAESAAIDSLFATLFGEAALDETSHARDALAAERLIGTWAWHGDRGARVAFDEYGIVRGSWVVREDGEELRVERDLAGRWRLRAACCRWRWFTASVAFRSGSTR